MPALRTLGLGSRIKAFRENILIDEYVKLPIRSLNLFDRFTDALLIGDVHLKSDDMVFRWKYYL